MAAKIYSCNCESEYQDKKYGKGNRVHSETAKKTGGNIGLRCSVCGKEK